MREMKQAAPPNLRLVNLIEALVRTGEPQGLSALSAQLDLPKPTFHRLVKQLITEGLAEKQGRDLVPSARLVTLANGILRVNSGNLIRHQILSELAASTGETINFVVPEKQGMTYLDRVETDWPLRMQFAVGAHVPFHCTASGKVYLSSLRTSLREKMVETLTLSAHTKMTITDKTALHAQLRAIRKAGFAVDDEELYPGMLALAVPVYDLQKRFHAAIGMHGPKQRLSREKALSFKDRMLASAQQLSHVLFG